MPSKTIDRSSLSVKRCKYLEDGISQLPDDVLVHILSFLAIQDAARTSVISHRWKDLWKSTPCLIFDGLTGLDISTFLAPKSPEAPKIREEARSKFVSCVNQVLKLHKCPSIDEFRIMFQLDDDNACNNDIYEWIKFALQKRVKILEINCGPMWLWPCECYSPSEECRGLLFQSTVNLTSLSLFRVNFSGPLLEYLLSNCPLLEKLSVALSNNLANLKVVGPSLQLKYLEIKWCFFLKAVEISAPKLVTFTFIGSGRKRTRFCGGNNPLLSDLVIGERGCRPVTFPLLRAFSKQISQIHTMKLVFNALTVKNIKQVPEFINLKHLELQYVGDQCKRLRKLTDIIVAAPYLHQLTLKLRTPWPEKARRIRKPVIDDHRRNHCLKYVTVDWFVGGIYDSELLAYLLKHAINLEKIAILKRPNCPGKHQQRMKEHILWFKDNTPAKCELNVE